ncbi:hypothetical protein [Sphaerisporangium fuscum]|uniref:hypothetical protein n=1 Tax=Sphaerisporangium fuscum TaxID=2835868 RepID=UPI001BDD87D6|nr:hypothetical protein [Sphaerisporangium fuscum]
MWRRVAPATGLFFLSPLVAEFLLGNIPISALFALVMLAPMYGGGALLIREVVRRSGRGWPAIVPLALAYGVLEEGVTTQSLFNPDYAGQRLLDVTYIPALGIGAWWSVFVLTLHTVWSISVPIAVMEGLTPARRTTPWLGRFGLGVTAVLFLFGVVSTTVFSLRISPFVASVPQFAAVAVAVVALVVIAFALGRPAPASVPAPGSAAPNAWAVGAVTLVASSAWFLLGEVVLGWATVAGYLLISALVAYLIARWSARPGWRDTHRVAAAGGAMLTYAWHAFPQGPIMPVSPTVDLIGNAVFAAGAVALLFLAVRRAGGAPVADLGLREGSAAPGGVS